MKRTIIKIDEQLCNGCGACVNGCHEGALRLINGKAVIVSELYCDGLGACIGECPVGAITLEEREAVPYDEESVMERLIPKGETVIFAHLKHLREHGETTLLNQGLNYLKQHNIPIPEAEPIPTQSGRMACGCPGSMVQSFRPIHKEEKPSSPQCSELRQFPVQLHLLNPQAEFFKGADLLVAADCTAFASGEFHSRFLQGKILAIACPKLDNNTQSYVEKLSDMIWTSKINSLTVLIMEVPCCGGLLKIAETAREHSGRDIPIKAIILSVRGEVKKEIWI